MVVPHIKTSKSKGETRGYIKRHSSAFNVPPTVRPSSPQHPYALLYHPASPKIVTRTGWQVLSLGLKPLSKECGGKLTLDLAAHHESDFELREEELLIGALYRL